MSCTSKAHMSLQLDKHFYDGHICLCSTQNKHFLKYIKNKVHVVPESLLFDEP